MQQTHHIDKDKAIPQAEPESVPGEETLGNRAESGQLATDDQPGTSRVGAFVMSVLSGSFLSRSEVRKVYPYLLFIAFLGFLYITNVFRVQSLYRRHEGLTRQVKELRAKSMTIASEKAEATRQSNIMLQLQRRGIPLEESLTPNKVIEK